MSSVTLDGTRRSLSGCNLGNVSHRSCPAGVVRRILPTKTPSSLLASRSFSSCPFSLPSFMFLLKAGYPILVFPILLSTMFSHRVEMGHHGNTDVFSQLLADSLFATLVDPTTNNCVGCFNSNEVFGSLLIAVKNFVCFESSLYSR